MLFFVVEFLFFIYLASRKKVNPLNYRWNKTTENRFIKKYPKKSMHSATCTHVFFILKYKFNLNFAFRPIFKLGHLNNKNSIQRTMLSNIKSDTKAMNNYWGHRTNACLKVEPCTRTC